MFPRLRQLALLTALAAAVFAQTTPPAQNYVVRVGTSPLKARATPDFSPGSSFTIEGWFYATGRTPFAWLAGKCLTTGGTDPFLAFGLLLNEDGTRVRFSASTGAPGSGRDVTAPTTLPLGTWTHIAAVMEGTAMRLLINGSVVATGTANGPVPALDSVPLGVGIAFLPNGTTNFPGFPGYARQVRFWNVPRTAAQIAAAMSESLPAARTGLIAAWPLDESDGTTARDISGNNRALTTASGPLVATSLRVLDNGPFYATQTTSVTDGSLSAIVDGELIDFDGDGDRDLIAFQIVWPPTIPETRARLRAFRNNNGVFVDATDAVLGNVTMTHPRHSVVADFNGDGRPDLFLVGHGSDTIPFPGEQSKLFIQTADGRLVDESSSRLPAHNSFTHNIAVGDIDGDGDLDVYMSNVNGGDVGPRFYINNGSGVFTEAADRVPADIANRTAGRNYTSAFLLDLNGDGRPELILGSGGPEAPENEILVNDGTGRFTRSATFVLPAKLLGPKSSVVAIATADFNGDGAPDLAFACTGGSLLMPDGRTIDGYSIPGIQILLNRGNGTFFQAPAATAFPWKDDERWVIWTRIADVNGDGRPDIVASVATESSGNRPRVFINRGAAEFVDATEALPSAGVITAVVQAADFDRDGRTDILTASAMGVSVSRNIKTLDRTLFESAPDDPGRLANLSVRTRAGTGDQTLITGFALSGVGTKPLLVRAVGPTLAAFGVGGTLVDPQVEIAPLGGANIATNNNWGGTAELKNAFAAVGAFSFTSDNSADAALTFAPVSGSYTAKVTGANNGTGVALVEVYDAGTGNSPRLTNVSARTQVGTGADVLIVGFVVNGNMPRKLLIRAVGPTLGAFGVGGTLTDPVLEVRPLGSENVVATNDDWRGTADLKAAFGAVGAFSFANDASRDAALAIELPPGAYTATVSGKGNTTGVALVEVYELPQP